VSRVLVTGAGGFIGRHTLAPLLAAGYEVYAVSSRPVSGGAPPTEELAGAVLASVSAPPALTDAPAAAPQAGVHWRHADLLVPGAVAELIAEVRPSHLLHLAWNTQPGIYWTTLENLDWVAASLALLCAFGEAGGRRAVVAGTCAEYAWERSTHCVEEDRLCATLVAGTPAIATVGAHAGGTRGRASTRLATPTRPATLYGAAKHALHVVAREWARQSDVALAWGRVFHVYGPHEHPDRLASGVARALLRGKEARCTHGRQVRDFLYAPELGGAFAALLRSEVTGPVNMASGELHTIAELVEEIAMAAGRPELVRLGALPANPAEPLRLTAEVRRLREEVGWRPTVGLSEGVERTVDWWRGVLAEQAQTGTGTVAGTHAQSPRPTAREVLG
jgi:dTDP-L-rhamnose 4-epimerase